MKLLIIQVIVMGFMLYNVYVHNCVMDLVRVWIKFRMWLHIEKNPNAKYDLVLDVITKGFEHENKMFEKFDKVWFVEMNYKPVSEYFKFDDIAENSNYLFVREEFWVHWMHMYSVTEIELQDFFRKALLRNGYDVRPIRTDHYFWS